MQVSRSAHYAWLRRAQTAGERDDAELAGIIVRAFKKSRATYGARRIKKALSGQDRRASRRRIGRLMREARLACKTQRKLMATTNSGRHLPIAENHLDRQFTVAGPDQVYAGDITYIHAQEGWLYLAVVIDLFSRQVVGWPITRRA